MVKTKNTKLPSSAERYLAALEMRCAEAVEEQRGYLAELWESEYSSAIGMLEALGMISHTDFLQRLEAVKALRFGAMRDCPQGRSDHHA